MPNGGSDCCGECDFNPNSLYLNKDLLPGDAGSCAIRGLDVSRPFSTYCANFHTGSRVPEGPVFAGFHEYGRLPWHGDLEVIYNPTEEGPCAVCGAARCVLLLATPTGNHRFCGSDHYLQWWRGEHPGRDGEYPWALHEAMFDARRRASGRDAPRGLRERLLWFLRH